MFKHVKLLKILFPKIIQKGHLKKWLLLFFFLLLTKMPSTSSWSSIRHVREASSLFKREQEQLYLKFYLIFSRRLWALEWFKVSGIRRLDLFMILTGNKGLREGRNMINKQKNSISQFIPFWNPQTLINWHFKMPMVLLEDLLSDNHLSKSHDGLWHLMVVSKLKQNGETLLQILWSYMLKGLIG